MNRMKFCSSSSIWMIPMPSTRQLEQNFMRIMGFHESVKKTTNVHETTCKSWNSSSFLRKPSSRIRFPKISQEPEENNKVPCNHHDFLVHPRYLLISATTQVLACPWAPPMPSTRPRTCQNLSCSGDK